jgi:hypothetical protein
MGLRRRSKDVTTTGWAAEHGYATPPGTDVTGAAPAPAGGVQRQTFVEGLLDRAVTMPSARVHAHVHQLRRKNPHASPAQIIAMLEREYLLIIQGAGGAVGAAAAAPGVGTGVAFTLTASDVATFFGASAAFSLAVASVHGIEVEDAARRRALLLATILGETGGKVVGDAAEISTVHFARTLLTRMPTGTIKKVNSTLTKRLIRRQAAKQGGLAFGRLAPFGIGALIGIAGARALGKPVVEGARLAFGPPPERFPQIIEVLETGGAPRLVPAPEQPREHQLGR